MDSTKKERCIQKARELAVEYQGTLVGCGHCSFAATLDALRTEGIEIVPKEIEEELFKGVLGLTGGIGNLGVGTCGAVSGASFAISLACNIGPKELAPNKALRWIPYYYVKRVIKALDGKVWRNNLSRNPVEDIWYCNKFSNTYQ